MDAEGKVDPEANADRSRAPGTIEEDLLWPNDWHAPFELQEALDVWPKDYNEDYPHSPLGHETPCEYERSFPANTTRFFT